MDQQKSMSITSRLKSFIHAFRGLVQFFGQEPNAKLHLVAALAIVIAGIVKHLNHWQWVAICFAIGIVWLTEAINTCIEKLCDFCCDNRYHASIKTIKDISAAAVLISALLSVAVGIIIFFF